MDKQCRKDDPAGHDVVDMIARTDAEGVLSLDDRNDMVVALWGMLDKRGDVLVELSTEAGST